VVFAHFTYHFVGGRASFLAYFRLELMADHNPEYVPDIPEGCGTEYKSRKVAPKRRGRPAKAKTVKLDS
jgi:hypothetical protein